MAGKVRIIICEIGTTPSVDGAYRLKVEAMMATGQIPRVGCRRKNFPFKMFVRHAVRSAARSGAASFSSKTIQQASRAAARTALAPSRQTGTPLRSSVFATAEATGLNGSFSTNAARRSTFASLETQSARMTLGQGSPLFFSVL